MKPENAPAGYNATQIALHWVIAALVLFQLVFGDWIKPAYRAFMRGGEPAPAQEFAANLHVYVGLAILALAIWRLAVRARRGVPEAPAGDNPVPRRVAAATHAVLYLVIFAMPVTGALAWFFGFRFMGQVHELAKPVIIAVIALHALAALWQHFYLRSGVLVRMLKAVPR
jgi:cytochrome b561